MFSVLSHLFLCCFFFFNDTATTEIYTLSLHDALPICADDLAVRRHHRQHQCVLAHGAVTHGVGAGGAGGNQDRKSTRLNSSHTVISYAVFCLKKKTIKVERRVQRTLHPKIQPYIT